MRTIIDRKDNIIEKNDNKDEHRYRLKKDNRILKNHEKSNDSKDDEEENEKNEKNDSEMNDIKEIIKIFD